MRHSAPQFVGLRPSPLRAAGVPPGLNSDVVRSSARLTIDGTTPFYGASDLTFDAGEDRVAARAFARLVARAPLRLFIARQTGFVPEITISGNLSPSQGGGVVVELRLADGTPVATTTTDSDGNYAFATDLVWLLFQSFFFFGISIDSVAVACTSKMCLSVCLSVGIQLSDTIYKIVVDVTQYPNSQLLPGRLLVLIDSAFSFCLSLSVCNSVRRATILQLAKQRSRSKRRRTAARRPT